MKYQSLFLALFVAFLLAACYVSKPLETEVRVGLSEVVPIKILKDEGATFVSNFGDADYSKAFIEGMTSSLGFDKVIVDNANPQFSITISELELSETTSSDTVKDEKSADNGKIYSIAVANLKATGTMVNLSTNKSITWTADKDKKEKVTSMRSLGQMVTGDNKELDEYRKKDFDKNEFVQLSSQCGNRAASVITNNIRRQLK